MKEYSQSGIEFDVDERSAEVVEGMLSKLGEARRCGVAVEIMDREAATGLLTAEEASLLTRVYDIKPMTYGYAYPYVGIEPVPGDLVVVGRMPYYEHGEERFTSVQRIPRHAHEAYSAMAQAAQAEIKGPLLITSSYRSDAYQALTFLSYLRRYNFNMAQTLRRVVPPGYSEHCTPSRLAFDLQTVDGLPSDDTPEDFAETKEYAWLMRHAAEYNFYLSYPEENTCGMQFEPWHWRHVPSGI